MGRSREFKHEEALNKAMHLFWERGYENTSLKDLLSEMNILNGSFYNCFKNKKNLFLMALEQYTNHYAVDVMNDFDSNKSFKENIRKLFETSLECNDINRPPGCFLVNCATSELIEDPEIGNVIRSKMNGFYDFVTDKMIEAQNNGEVSKEIDPVKTTELMLSFLHGRMQLSKFFPHDRKSKEQVELFLTSIGV